MKTNILIILILALGFYGCNESEGSQSGNGTELEMTQAELAAKVKAALAAELDRAGGPGNQMTDGLGIELTAELAAKLLAGGGGSEGFKSLAEAAGMTEAEWVANMRRGATKALATGTGNPISIDKSTVAGQAFLTCPLSISVYTQYIENQGPQTCAQADGTPVGCNCSIIKLSKKGEEPIFSNVLRKSCQREYIKLATNQQECMKFNSAAKGQTVHIDANEGINSAADLSFGESL